MASCFRICLECIQGPSYFANQTRLIDLPQVSLDTEHMGNEVVIVKNGRRLCGVGGAFANAPLVQNKSYFEVKIQQSGAWGVGVATRRTDLNKLPLGQDADSWVLRDDGKLYHNGQASQSLTSPVEEGDVIGITYDHVELRFYVNGKPSPVTCSGVKGTSVFPVFYVDDGAILDINFADFVEVPPEGFDRIMLEQTLL